MALYCALSEEETGKEVISYLLHSHSFITSFKKANLRDILRCLLERSSCEGVALIGDRIHLVLRRRKRGIGMREQSHAQYSFSRLATVVKVTVRSCLLSELLGPKEVDPTNVSVCEWLDPLMSHS